MVVNLIRIFHEDDDSGNISTEVNLPLSDIRYCIQILKLLDSAKSSLIKQIHNQCKINIENEKGLIYRMQQMLGTKLSSKDSAKLCDELKTIEISENLGRGIQISISKLSNDLNRLDISDREKALSDINTAIERITRGG